MPSFQYITDLPPQVRNILDIPLQQVFMDTYNSALQLVGTDAEAYTIAWMKVLQTAFPGEVLSLPSMPRMAPAPIPQASGAYGTIPMSDEYTYLSDLRTFLFDEGADAGWIQAMPIGKYNHPVYGVIDVTPEKVQQFAQNVNTKVRDTDLDIDYDHKDKTTEAAGWVRKAEARKDGLWLFVDWTKKAAQAIREKAYRYFSPEFVDSWTHPKTGVKYQNVLFGGGLTNRPFLKDILPVNLSEIFSDNESGGSMDPKKLRKLLGLSETATDAEVQAAVDTAVTKLETNPDGGNGGDGGGDGGDGGNGEGNGEGTPNGEPAPEGTPEPQAVNANDLRTLAEKDPVIRALVDKVNNLEMANRLSEVNLKLSEMQNGQGKKYAVPPTVIEELRSLCVDAPTKQFGDKVLDLVSKIQANGLIELGERGTNGGGPNGGGLGKSAAERVAELAQKKMSENQGMSYADAMDALSIEDPQLYDEYRNESYIRMRGDA